jgi:hypothetical protein
LKKPPASVGGASLVMGSLKNNMPNMAAKRMPLPETTESRAALTQTDTCPGSFYFSIAIFISFFSAAFFIKTI